MTSPYEPPVARRDARPAVLFWYRVYAGFMTMVALAGTGLAFYAAKTAEAQGLLVPALWCVASAAVLVLFGVATFVPFKPWGWTVGLVAIGLGVGGCSMVAAVPLLVFWMKPETRAAFARL